MGAESSNNGSNQRVKQILSWYGSENNAVLGNLYKLMNTGTLAGTGKLVVLPVDQGFEHGPARTFGPNPDGYDSRYHFNLAIESGCSAHAAPYGQIASANHEFAGQIPLIVKVNNSDSLFPTKNPVPAITCSVKDALQVGATAIGFTIYPGSCHRKEMYQEIREMGEEARSYGMPVVIWSYPRGESLSKDGETGIDVVAYAAQIACQLGGHIIKVKPPTAHIEQDAAKKAYEANKINVESLPDRIKHVVQSCFGGRRIVIFSGGAAKSIEEVMSEIKGLAQGGAFGSIMGRNAFQRPKADAVKLLSEVMATYKAA